MRKRVKYTNTQPNTFLSTHAPHSLAPTQSRILSDPQLHQQRTKSRLKRVKSCCVLFKISFFYRVTIGQVRLRVIFLHISRTQTHTQTSTFTKHSHVEERIEAEHKRETTDGSHLASLTQTNTDTQYEDFRFLEFFVNSIRLGSNPLQFLQFLHQYFKGKKKKQKPTDKKTKR